MHTQALGAQTRRNGIEGWRLDLCIALAGMAVLLAVEAAGGFASLGSMRGDNDSLLRLVQIRDLLAGQSWFDLMQHRMGPPGGFLMHWSRVVDVPVAALMLAGEAVGGSQAAGEAFALVTWPLLTFGAALLLTVRIARALGGAEAVLPAAVIAGLTLYGLGLYAPGSLDHHNLQLALCLAMLWCLIEAGTHPRRAAGAGVAAALMLAIGMETLPFVALGCGLAALAYLASGRAIEARAASAFGFAFAVSALALLPAIVAPAQWWMAQCDAYSARFAVLATVGGLGLAGIALLARGRAVKWGAMAALGAVAGALVVTVLPQCLGDPYAALDPRLKSYWLDWVSEAQPAWELARNQPADAIAAFATPLVALAVLVVRIAGRGGDRATLLTGIFLAAAIAMAVWQIRGQTFALALAVPLLASWVAERRRLAADGKGGAVPLLAAWLISFSTLWTAASHAAVKAIRPSPPVAATAAGGDATCQAAASFAALGALPPTRVLAISNLGSPILAYTGHSVLAGPYHRNVVGNLTALDAQTGPAAAARAIVERDGIGLVAVCAANPESRMLAQRAPDGLLADLMGGKVPDWLKPVGPSGVDALTLYRVEPARP
jgi:hypothetical protein